MKNVTPAAETGSESNERLLAVVGYVLFLIGPANFLTMIIAALIAWFRRENAPEWIANHYEFQLRTLFYAIVLLVIAAACALTVILLPVAFLIWLLWTLWVIIRVVVGLIRLIDGRPNPDPKTFWV
ncbi:hypothetical protein V0U79_02570 [Hyphobacterium sp. HN65]|uniref:DUF4870 domain-containing protein n=1 Tax=Hyphobacterium lacteum TaxID=3116575 RepID=A0ABU7LMS6_9PROT|nr:hypothetical protein [Hyphobacterium sp. HN65]MEE2525233.1 hypothetical protein [Hyphobacterium sp. HN65]